MTAGSRWRRWRADALAGLVNAVVSVPDGLAAGALAGVNPVYGLYASIAGRSAARWSAGRLYLSGVDGDVGAQLRRAGKLDLDRAVHLVPASAVLGASTGHAVESASAWLGRAR
jgi:hypothetical protein